MYKPTLSYFSCSVNLVICRTLSFFVNVKIETFKSFSIYYILIYQNDTTIINRTIMRSRLHKCIIFFLRVFFRTNNLLHIINIHIVMNSIRRHNNIIKIMISSSLCRIFPYLVLLGSWIFLIPSFSSSIFISLFYYFFQKK